MNIIGEHIGYNRTVTFNTNEAVLLYLYLNVLAVKIEKLFKFRDN